MIDGSNAPQPNNFLFSLFGVYNDAFYNNSRYYTWSKNKFEWYTDYSPNRQLNSEDTKYYWIAF